MMLDGVGVGALPDAAEYGDSGSNTLGNVARLADLHLPNFERLGLGNIAPLRGVPPVPSPDALVGRLAPHSAGKDTTVGHWEHMGLITAQPFPTYPDGFPAGVLEPFSQRIGRGVLGNKPASGTAIIDELGAEHMATGRPIVYTSADSVFQIAAHVDIVPLEQLYEWCAIAREILQGPHAMARVIARPFTGSPGEFVRTKDRRDFSLEPPSPIYLDLLRQAGVPVLALGKISEIFLGRGVTTKIKVASNTENLSLLLDLLRGTSDKAVFDEGFLFTNLVDFDMAWGHRNDVDGFAAGLEAVDAALPEILGALGPDDRLIISADHGVDPTTVSTDHSREYVPVLLCPRPGGAPQAVYEGVFSDTGATICEFLTGDAAPLAGRSLYRLEPERGWRPYTPTLAMRPGEPAWSVKLDLSASRDAAHWLYKRLGAAPEVAIVLGSGLSAPFKAAAAENWSAGEAVKYSEIPNWLTPGVAGHPGLLEVGKLFGHEVALLEGRVHGYEGFDPSELQLAVRAMAAWGVRKIALTCAAGAVDRDLTVGDVVLVENVLDFQYALADGGPGLRVATDPVLVAALIKEGTALGVVRAGVHAAVPGPQYETEAELDLLLGLGVTCVSMSLPAELRAAEDERMQVGALSLITNAGPADHDTVLASGSACGHKLLKAVELLLKAWA